MSDSGRLTIKIDDAVVKVVIVDVESTLQSRGQMTMAGGYWRLTVRPKQKDPDDTLLDAYRVPTYLFRYVFGKIPALIEP